MKTKVKQKKRIRKADSSSVSLSLVGEKYFAYGPDAVLIGHHLRIPFFSKKVEGTFLDRTSFAAIHFLKFSQMLAAVGIQVSVVPERSLS